MDELLNRPATDAEPDEALLRAYAERGDREAMGRLLLRHHRAAWSLARSHGLSGSDADDAVQAAFISALGAAGGFAGRSTVRSWLLGFVINACRNLARSHRRRRAHEGASPMPTASTANPSSPELLDALRAALAALPEIYRVPLELRYLHGLEPSEVAETLRAAPATIRSRLARGLARLREALASRRLALEEGALGAAIAALPTPTPAGGAPTLVAEWVRSGTLPAGKVAAVAGFSLAVKALIAAALATATIGGIALAARRQPPPPPAAVIPAPHPAPPSRLTHATPPGEEALRRTVSVRFAGEDLGEALKLIADATHLGCECPDPIRRVGSIAAAAEPMTLRELLDRRIAAAASGLRWEYRDGAIAVWRDVPNDRLADLQQRATGGDTESRCEAVAALGQLADPRIYPTLFTAATGGDAAVAEWALRALRRHTDTLHHGAGVDDFAATLAKSIVLPPPKPLVASMAPLEDHDRNLRGIHLLAATRSTRATDTLRAALDHLPLRQTAWEGLCAIDDRRAEDAAIAAYAAWRDRPKDRRPISGEMRLGLDPLVANRDLVLRADLDSSDRTLREIGLEAATRWPDAAVRCSRRAAQAGHR